MDFKSLDERLCKKYCKSWIFIGEDLLKSLNYFIMNPPTGTIMNTGTLNNDAISFLRDDFDLGYPIHGNNWDWYIQRQAIPRGTNVYDFLNDPENATKDAAWIKDRNEGLRYEAYLKYDYTPALQAKIVVILQELRQDFTQHRSLKEKYNIEQKREREQAQKEFTVEILDIDTRAGGEGGHDPSAKVKITDSKTGESGFFSCRNIFDFGYVVNRNGGGLLNNVEAMIKGNPITFDTDEKKAEYRKNRPTTTGWGWDRYFLDGPDWIEATDFEIRAVKYLSRFSPIETGIRM